jgi:hypothetical protein
MSEPARLQRPKHRSPSYPSIDLGTAVQRTHELWTHAQRHPVPMADAMRLWGYSPKSSGGLQTIAALKKYGLAEDEGKGANRQVRVSDLGRAIVTDDPQSPARLERLRQAFMNSTIYRELWEDHGPTAPDTTLRFYLVNKRGYSESAARDVIDGYRKSAEVAALADVADSLSYGYHDKDETGVSVSTVTNPPSPSTGVGDHRGGTSQAAPSQLKSFHLPVGPGRAAVLTGPFPISESQWRLMTTVLEAMKPGLVSEEEPASSAPDDPQPPL